MEEIYIYNGVGCDRRDDTKVLCHITQYSNAQNHEPSVNTHSPIFGIEVPMQCNEQYRSEPYAQVGLNNTSEKQLFPETGTQGNKDDLSVI